jgi:hypothetical protein
MQRISGKKKRTVFRSDPVSSAGQSVSGLSIDGPNITIVNPAPTQDSSGKVVSAGTPILSVGVNEATINASYIKTGVLDANLMRTGQIQTIASWNSRSYGSDLDAIEAQQGFTGGYVYLQDWSTVSENTVYAEFAPWGTYESGTTTATVGASTMFSVGDYVRVTGAYFGDPDQLTRSVGFNANVGIIDQQDGPLGYGEIVAVDTVGTGVTYTVTSTSKSTLDSGLVAKSQQYIPTMSKANQILSIDAQRISGPNPAGIYSVFVTTSMPHDFVVGDYIELASCGPVYSGVWYVVSTPSNNTFVFRHRFNLDFGAVISSESLPSIDAPVAIRVRKAYSVTSNGDLTSASLNIRTAKTQDGGEPVFQVLNDSIVIRKPDGSILLGVTAGGSFIDIGTVTADEVIVGGDINANQVVRAGNYPNAISPTFQGIWAGNATPASAEFSVDLDGNLVASNANITGTVRASSGQIGGFTIGATALTATNIVANSSGYVSVGSGNNVAVMSGADANYRFWAGNSNAATANFVVDKAGNITARSFSLTGIGSISAINAITVSDVLGAGVVTNAKIATVSADKIQTNTLTLSGLSAAAITSTNFVVTNTGSVTASDITLSNSDSVTVGASQVGSINVKPQPVGSTNVGGALFTVWSNAKQNSAVNTVSYSSFNISTITGGTTVGATWTVTTTTAHDIGVGQYVSFTGLSGGTGLSAWSQVCTQNGAVRVTASSSSTTFQFKSPYAFAAPTTSQPKVYGYKTLTLVAPGGVFIADAINSTLSPGMIGVGSIALGSNFESIGGDSATSGIDGTPKPADGEIVFTSATTNPIYDGGGNLYSSDGATTINTSGAFTAGSHITGDRLYANGYLYTYHGGLYLRGGTVNPTIYFRNSANTDLGNITHNGTYLQVSDRMDVAGALNSSSTGNFSGLITATGGVTANGVTLNGTYDLNAYGSGSSIYINQTAGIYFTDTSKNVQSNLYYVTGSAAGWRLTGVQAVGTVAAYWSANATTAYLGRLSSSRRYKENISYTDFDIEDIVKLRPANFTVKEEFRANIEDEDGNPTGEKEPAKTKLGIIAEDGEDNPAWEDLVIKNEDGQTDSWAYQHMGVVLLSAVRTLYAQNKALEARIAELEARE